MRHCFYKLNDDGRKVGYKAHEEANTSTDELVDATQQSVNYTVNELGQAPSDSGDNPWKLCYKRKQECNTCFNQHWDC